MCDFFIVNEYQRELSNVNQVSDTFEHKLARKYMEHLKAQFPNYLLNIGIGRKHGLYQVVKQR